MGSFRSSCPRQLSRWARKCSQSSKHVRTRPHQTAHPPAAAAVQQLELISVTKAGPCNQNWRSHGGQCSQDGFVLCLHTTAMAGGASRNASVRRRFHGNDPLGAPGSLTVDRKQGWMRHDGVSAILKQDGILSPQGRNC